MQKKLTITVSEEVYDGLYAKIGRRNISRFLDRLARPHVVDDALRASYAEMARDVGRESDADEWTENLTREIADEAR